MNGPVYPIAPTPQSQRHPEIERVTTAPARTFLCELCYAWPTADDRERRHRPLPIPSLDKNGSHNQPAGPNLEPSHIYHFKGRVARCSTFTGTGTDNQGNRIAFGSPTTDYGVMQGEYWAARAPQQGTFTHI